jgi:hypothetical protein
VIKLNEPPLLFLWVPFLASMLIALGHESLSRPFVNTSSEGLCNSALFLCGMALDFSLHLESLGFASIDSKGAVAPYGDLMGLMGANLKEPWIDSLTTCVLTSLNSTTAPV